MKATVWGYSKKHFLFDTLKTKQMWKSMCIVYAYVSVVQGVFLLFRPKND